MHTTNEPHVPAHSGWLQSKLFQLLKTYVCYNRQTSLTPDTTITLSWSVQHERLAQMPPEVVRIILQHLLMVSQPDSVQALCVSQMWANLGERLLWKDVVLTSKNIAHFVHSLSQSTRNLKFVQSLTLKLESSDTTESNLAALTDHLNLFTQLKTFSLSMDSSHRASAPSIESLLQYLPLSITSLELGILPAKMAPSGLRCNCFAVKI